jgi:DNA-binding MarR family transcriptional regulator
LDNKERLLETCINFFKIKGECSCKVIDELDMSGLTIKQLEYIRQIDRHEHVTSSELARIFDLSKPSVTEMVKKFIAIGCVYKKQCHNDGRIYYLELTERGKKIARVDEITVSRLVDRIVGNLNENEIEKFIELIEKVK